MKLIWERLNIEVLLTQFVSWLPSLLAAVLIIGVFYLLYRITRPILSDVLHKIGLEHALTNMLIGVYRFALMTLGVVMAAGQLGINVGAALAGLGVVGLTIGFAAKDSLSNIMAGFLIFWDKPFHLGDWVTMGDHYGKVSEITLRTTRVQTRNNTWVVIPNEKVINQILVNHSANGPTRVNVPIGIGYPESITQARRVLLQAIAGLDTVLKDPAPQVVLDNLGGSSMNLLVFVWIADAQHEKPVFFQVLETAKTTLDAAGIEIPFPKLDMSITSIKGEIWQEMEKVARVNGSSTQESAHRA
jgi:small conductance mechanosensitive channel